MEDENKRCCLCGKELEGPGNNPFPLAAEGRCCDECKEIVTLMEECWQEPIMEKLAAKHPNQKTDEEVTIFRSEVHQCEILNSTNTYRFSIEKENDTYKFIRHFEDRQEVFLEYEHPYVFLIYNLKIYENILHRVDFVLKFYWALAEVNLMQYYMTQT